MIIEIIKNVLCRLWFAASVSQQPETLPLDVGPPSEPSGIPSFHLWEEQLLVLLFFFELSSILNCYFYLICHIFILLIIAERA